MGVGAGTYWQWAEATLGSPGRAAEPGMPSRSLVHTIVMGEWPGGTLAVGPFVGVGAGTYWQWAEATLGCSEWSRSWAHRGQQEQREQRARS